MGFKSILFFISTLGWFNGVILSIYFLFFVKNNTLANRLLGLLLLCLSLRISKSAVWYFNPQLPVIFIQLGLCICLFIGPLLILYIKTSLNQTNTLPKIEKGILLLHIVGVLVLLLFFSKNLPLWKQYFIKLIYTQWLLSVLMAGYYLIPFLNTSAFKNFTPPQKWLLGVYISNVSIAFFYTISFYKIFNLAYISGAIAFSVIIYLNFLIVLYRKQTPYLFNSEKYQNKKIEEKIASPLIQKLSEIIQKEEIYGDAALNLTDLAKHLDIPPHQLSQLLNDNLQKSFSTYLTEFRIQKACALLVSGSDLKIEAIGYEVGFQSKSTFFAAFKKITGTTPTLFRESKIA